MARSTPTEDSLGLTPTDDELATIRTPADDGDDIPLDDEPTPVVDASQPGVKEAPKTADAPVDPAADPAAKQEDPKTVDLRALQEARAEAREAKQRNALLEQRTNEILAAFTAQQAAQQYQEPPRERPVGDPLALLEYLAEKVDRQEITANEARQYAEQEGYRQQNMRQLHVLEVQFQAAKPDYFDAVNHLRDTRNRELEIMFPLANADQRAQYIAQEWQQVVAQSVQAGLNPAEQVYNLSLARGFTAPQAAAAAAATTQQRQSNLSAVAAAQQRHQSLSDAPGGETIAPLDAKSLARMSDKDFKAWMSKKGNEAKFDEIMGR